ncbi:hypothetical protein F5Y01DRAFT_329459 [Xylaria sp. FL0043]|nr:hypothetical protein F5Y01DRAFT_329459 [Xylaria sp. FL0043]
MDEDIGPRNDDRGPGFRNFIIFLFVITTTAISLRFWSRSITPTHGRAPRFCWDDWLALAAVPLILSLLVTILILIDLGLGHHIWLIDPLVLLTLLKVLFAAHFVWDVALFLCRESALFFVRRVFPRDNSSRSFNVVLYATHGLNTAWFIGAVAGSILRCQPVARNWNRNLSGKCGSVRDLWLGVAITSLAIDLTIVLLPMPTIWGLNITNKSRRFGLIVTFALGYFVCLVTVGRLVTILILGDVLDQDITYAGIPALYWILADNPLTLLSICLPAMVRLYNNVSKYYLSPLMAKVSSTFGSRGTGEPSSSLTGKPSSRHFRRIEHDIENSRSDELFPSAPTAQENSYPMHEFNEIYEPVVISQPYSVRVDVCQPTMVSMEHLSGQSIHVVRDLSKELKRVHGLRHVFRARLRLLESYDDFQDWYNTLYPLPDGTVATTTLLDLRRAINESVFNDGNFNEGAFGIRLEAHAISDSISDSEFDREVPGSPRRSAVAQLFPLLLKLDLHFDKLPHRKRPPGVAA